MVGYADQGEESEPFEQDPSKIRGLRSSWGFVDHTDGGVKADQEGAPKDGWPLVVL
jgi:hypothetical protein